MSEGKTCHIVRVETYAIACNVLEALCQCAAAEDERCKNQREIRPRRRACENFVAVFATSTSRSPANRRRGGIRGRKASEGRVGGRRKA